MTVSELLSAQRRWGRAMDDLYGFLNLVAFVVGAGRARELGVGVMEIWLELLERLPGLPVARPHTAEEVRTAVALPIPAEPMPLDRGGSTPGCT